MLFGREEMRNDQEKGCGSTDRTWSLQLGAKSVSSLLQLFGQLLYKCTDQVSHMSPEDQIQFLSVRNHYIAAVRSTFSGNRDIALFKAVACSYLFQF